MTHPDATTRRRQIKAWIAWGLCAPWALFAVIRLFGLESGVYLVELLAFTPLIAATAVIPLIAAVLLRAWPPAVLAVAVLLVFAVMVLPRAFGGPTEASGERGSALRVLAANMELGEGSPQGLVEVVDELDVDVLSVEELTPELAQRLEAQGIGEQLEYERLQPRHGSLGSGLYSRVPLESSRELDLPGGFPLISASVTIPGSAAVEVFSVHTLPPTTQGWEEDLAALPAATPTRIMLGDFNATLDHAAFRDLLGRGYEDAARTLGEGLAPTWPADRRGLPALVAIDHAIAGEAIGIRDFSTHELPGSDHLGVFVELELPAG